MTKPETQARLDEALTRLLAGQPIRTDGELTVSNLCREAGVGRDSFYRTPALVTRFEAAKANAAAHQPELIRLREEIASLKREWKTTNRRHAGMVRELENTIRTYANQIQVLTLAHERSKEENRRLRERLEHQAANVAQIAERR